MATAKWFSFVSLSLLISVAVYFFVDRHLDEASIPFRVFLLAVVGVVYLSWLAFLAVLVYRLMKPAEAANLCPACGYDLRAAKTAARNAARRSRWRNPRGSLEHPDKPSTSPTTPHANSNPSMKCR